MAASQPLQDVAVLMLECGCRPDEIYSLRKQDVNLGQEFLMIQYGKIKSARRPIPLTSDAQMILQTSTHSKSIKSKLFKNFKSITTENKKRQLKI